MISGVELTCFACDDEVTVASQDVCLVITPSGLNSYAFTCPSCGAHERRPASPGLTRALLLVRPCVHDTTTPASASDPWQPLTDADVDEFARRIRHVDYLAAHARLAIERERRRGRNP